MALITGSVGCRSSRGGSGGNAGPGGGIASSDPLLGGARIPPQNLPVPGKDSYGSRGTRDPLLISPTGLEDRGQKATQQNPDKPTNSKGDGTAASRPRSRREPWRPGLEATNAALAAGLRPDDSTLSIGDRRPVGATASTSVPLRPRAVPTSATTESPNGYESLIAALKQTGAKWEPPMRDGDGYVMRADLPVSSDTPGLVRRYEGAGPTPAAAAQQLLDQIRSDQVVR